MGMFRDFENELHSMRYLVSDEIMGQPPQRENQHREQKPGNVRKLSSAFVSGFYATRNIHRAQYGPNSIHTGPSMGCPAPGHKQPELSM